MKLLTWNMEGSNDGEKWSALTSIHSTHPFDVACVQECGDTVDFGGNPVSEKQIKAHLTVSTYNLGTSSRECPVYVTHLVTSGVENRCSLAIVSFENKFVSGTIDYAEALGSFQYRPALYAQVNLGGSQNLYVSSIHAASGGGGDAPGLVKAVAQECGKSPLVVAGDYNRDPSSIMGLDASFTIMPPNAATRPKSGKKLDYAIASHCGGRSAIGQVLSVGMSDHDPVLYDL